MKNISLQKLLILYSFTTKKTWTQPKCPSTVEWIYKMCYRHRLEYYSALKRNKLKALTWRDYPGYLGRIDVITREEGGQSQGKI